MRIRRTPAPGVIPPLPFFAPSRIAARASSNSATHSSQLDASSQAKMYVRCLLPSAPWTSSIVVYMIFQLFVVIIL